MRQLSPFPLWLGHAGDGQDLRQLLDAGMEALVQLAEEEPVLRPPHELCYCRFPLRDGSNNRPALLRFAVQTVAMFLQNGVRTLICCGAGRSRSPAIAAAALALVQGGSPQEWLQRIAEMHGIDVSPGLWADTVQTQSSLSSGGLEHKE